MDENLKKLVEAYEAQYPKDESPLNYTFVFSLEQITEKLEKREGRRIYYKFDENGDDSGTLEYRK